MRSTASAWPAFESRASKRSGARRVMARNCALYLANASTRCRAHSRGVRRSLTLLEVLYQRVGECAGGDFRGALHLARKVIGHGLLADGLVHGAEDLVRRLHPAQVAEHHLAGEDHRAGIDLVEVGVLRRRAVGRLEHRVPGQVVDVAAWGDTDTPDLRRQRVREVVAVEVRRRDNVELLGARQHLLQRDVGNGILDDDSPGLARGVHLGVGLLFAPGRLAAFPLLPGVGVGSELTLGERIAPVAERALGELLDVALVHQGHALAPVAYGVIDGGADKPLRAVARDRLEADAGAL